MTRQQGLLSQGDKSCKIRLIDLSIEKCFDKPYEYFCKQDILLHL